MCIAAAFVAIAEWVFWEEFSTRFNFIAVDYLLYTHEDDPYAAQGAPKVSRLTRVTVGAEGGTTVQCDGAPVLTKAEFCNTCTPSARRIAVDLNPDMPRYAAEGIEVHLVPLEQLGRRETPEDAAAERRGCGALVRRPSPRRGRGGRRRPRPAPVAAQSATLYWGAEYRRPWPIRRRRAALRSAETASR